ncbi:MAG TPA: group III truncated hemoglobin [Verrucomicrobiae bacterium]
MNVSLLERMGGRPVLLNLLRHFYADVRQHVLIGPIFTAHITDWPAHLEKIADFWSTIAGGPPAYSGPMGAKHMPLELKEEHFQAWLGLWEHNCKVWLAADCAAEMIQFARSIALRLRLISGVTIPADSLGASLTFGTRPYGQKPSVRLQSGPTS